MDRIYNRAEDKNSANIIVYGKASDTKAYSDEACTMQCTTSELKNAFMKGCIVAIGSDSMYYPVSLLENSETKTANIVCILVTGDNNTMTPIVLSSVSDD